MADPDLFANMGITPACAGKSRKGRWRLLPPKDHPRVCGEKPDVFSFSVQLVGSPPRVRGKVALLLPRAGCGGITPACAGKRPLENLTTSTARDHPRVCGEKTHDLLTVHLQEGSPPRVRGKASLFHALGNNHRITPACAGKSVRRENSSS